MDLIDRQAAIDALGERPTVWIDDDEYSLGQRNQYDCDKLAIETVPSAQPEQTACKYCHEDSDGFVYPIEKNSHAWLVRHGKGMNLRIGFKGEYRECCILFCPMCGRRLNHE